MTIRVEVGVMRMRGLKQVVDVERVSMVIGIGLGVIGGVPRVNLGVLGDRYVEVGGGVGYQVVGVDGLLRGLGRLVPWRRRVVAMDVVARTALLDLRVVFNLDLLLFLFGGYL